MKKAILGLHVLCGLGLLVAGACSDGGSGGSAGSGGTGGSGTSSGGSGGATATGPKGICASYVQCVSATDPSGLGNAQSTYGEDGSCWKGSATAAAQCDMACRVGLQKVLMDAPSHNPPKECFAGIVDNCVQLEKCDSMSNWQSFVQQYGPDGNCWKQATADVTGDKVCTAFCECELKDQCNIGDGANCTKCYEGCDNVLHTSGVIPCDGPTADTYNALKGCACGDKGACQTECADRLCMGVSANEECDDCLSLNCPEPLKACQAN